MTADYAQWQLPKNEAGKFLGWAANGREMENKDVFSVLGMTSLNIAHYDAASAISIPAAIQNITLHGRRSFGDRAGQIPCVRVAVQPTTHSGWVRTADRYLPNGTIDNTNGGYWEFAIGGFANVIAFGARANGTADDWSAIQGSVNYINAKWGSGGCVFFPAAQSSYVSLSTIDLSTKSITLRGENQSVIVHSGGLDINLLKINFREILVKDLSFYGKGINGLATADTDIGATEPCVWFTTSAVNSVLDHCIIYGGYNAVLWEGGDCKMYDCEVSRSYGDALVKIKGGSGWLRRDALDLGWTVAHTGSQSHADPIPARTNATVYSAGNLATIGDYIVQCVTGGTSHASTTPTVKNYYVNFTDGNVTWRLLCPTNHNALRCSDGATEVYCHQIDMTGPFSWAIELVTSPGLYFKMETGICGQIRSGAIRVDTATDASFSGLTCGGPTGIDTASVRFGGNFAGTARFINNAVIGGAIGVYWAAAAGASLIATGNSIACSIGGGTKARALEVFTDKGNFNFSDNVIMPGCTTGVVVLPGTSDHYKIVGNIDAAGLGSLVADGGTGINKYIAGNV